MQWNNKVTSEKRNGNQCKEMTMTCVVLNVFRAVWLKAPFFRDTKSCHCVTGFLPSKGLMFL
jgi:hypothetical protein